MPTTMQVSQSELQAQLQEQEHQRQLAQTLLDISGELLGTYEPDQLLQKILRLLKRLVEYDSAGIHIVQGGDLCTRAYVGRATETMEQTHFARNMAYVWQYVEHNKTPYVTGDISQEEPWNQWPGSDDISSFMAMPMTANETVIGILTVDHHQPSMYEPAHVELVRIFANYAAIALENVRLLSESQRYRKDLKILQSIELIEVSEVDASATVHHTVDVLQQVFGDDFVSVYKIVGDSLHLLAQRNYTPASIQYVVPLSKGIMARCVRTQQAQFVANVAREEEFFGAAPDLVSELCVPIFVNDRIYGVINVESQQSGKLGERDLRLLTILANKLGVSLHNINLYAEVRRRLSTMSILHASSLDLVSEMDETDLFDSFMGRIVHLAEAEAVGIFLFDAHKEALVTKAVTGNVAKAVGDVQDKEKGVIGRAFTKGIPVYTAHDSEFPDRAANPSAEKFASGAVLAIPLQAKGKSMGVLCVGKEMNLPFGTEEIQLISLLANQMATALENRRLFQAEQRRIRQLVFLNEITATALRTSSFQEVLNTLIHQLGTLIGADSSYIMLWDGEYQKPVMAAAYRASSDSFPAMEVRPGEQTLTTSVLESNSVLTVEDCDDSPYISPAIARQLSIQSALGLPLIVDDEKLGAAILGFKHRHQFTREEIVIGQQAANQASVAIAKAKLLQTERQQRQFAETQLAFSFELMNTTDLARASQLLLTTIGQVVDYDAGSVMLLEPGTSDIGYVAAVSGYTDPEEARYRTLDVTEFPLLDKMRAEQQAVYVPDVREREDWRPGRQPDPEEVRTVLLAPLIYGQQDEVIGCLTLKSYRPRRFSLEARQNIMLLCNQTASALRNLLLFEETRRRLNEVSILSEISERLNRTLELEELLQYVLDRIIEILDPEDEKFPLSGSIILRQSPADTLHMAASHNIDPKALAAFNHRPFYAHEGSFKRCLLQGEWVELTTPEMVQANMVQTDQDMLQYDELLHIPIKVDAEVIGLIAVNRVTQDTNTRRLLGAIADLAGAALQKTQLLHQARSQAVELMAAHETLHEMDRMREEFIQNVTHDLRAPLTFIRGYIELMMEGVLGPVTDEQKEALEIVQDRTDAATQLVSDILDANKIESQPLQEEPVYLETIANIAVRSARVAAQKAGLTINLAIETAENCVLGDAQRLGQVFDNLLSNAIKYSPDGGTIGLQIYQRGAKVFVSIADSGIGIPADELDRIWDRYYRVKNTSSKYSGTGLGLANVRRIVEAHGGRIWVESNPDGTQFTFELPLVQEEKES